MTRSPLRIALLVLAVGVPARSDTIEEVMRVESQPFGVVVTAAGSIVFTDMPGNTVRTIEQGNGFITFRPLLRAGGEHFEFEGQPAPPFEFREPHALAAPRTGGLLIADTGNFCVRRLDPKTSEIRTLAGTGRKGFSGDGGPARKARFGGVYSIALTADEGTMMVADLDNRRVRAVDLKTGVVRTVAGNGEKGVPKDGAKATEAPLVDPRAVAVDPDGRLYIAERGGHALRVVEPDGTIRTVAGTGKAGLSGDGGPALEATLNGPKDLAIDRDGGVLIADTENHCVRKYWPKDGRITRVAGSGEKGAAGVGGPPEALEMARPHGVFVEKSGSILISDSENGRILRVVRD